MLHSSQASYDMVLNYYVQQLMKVSHLCLARPGLPLVAVLCCRMLNKCGIAWEILPP